jgi:hypothetical protein
MARISRQVEQAQRTAQDAERGIEVARRAAADTNRARRAAGL